MNKLRAVGLTRVSTADQVQNTSLGNQRSLIKKECLRRGWELVGMFEDAGVSGTRNDRPALNAAFEAAHRGEYDILVVYRLDRLGRSVVNVMSRIEELNLIGVGFVSLSEAFDTSTPAGRAMVGVMSVFAQFERESIVARSVAGSRAKAVTGWPGSKPPLGWSLTGKGATATPAPDPAEREAVARMVELVLAGLTCGQIADRLNREEVPTRTGALWSHAVVRKTLQNPALWTGEYRWGGVGKANGRYFKTATGRDGKPKYGEPVTILLPEPPLDQTTWEAVQAVLDASPRAGRKQDNQVSQLLTGRVFGTCNRHYLGTMVKRRSGEVVAKYRPQCQRRPHPDQPECDCREVDAAKLDELVWAQVAEVLGDGKRLQKLAGEWLAQAAIPEADARELEVLEERLRVLDRAIKRASDQAFLAEEPEDLLVRVAAYQDEKRSLVSRRASLVSVGPEARRASERLSDLASLASRAASRLRSMTREQQREVLALLEVRVVVAGPHRDGLPERVAIHGVLDPRAA